MGAAARAAGGAREVRTFATGRLDTAAGRGGRSTGRRGRSGGGVGVGVASELARIRRATLFTALLLRRKYLLWRYALACERLRCEPWRPWEWGETTRGPRRPGRAQGGGTLRPVMNECATRMLRAALLMFCASPQTVRHRRRRARAVASGAGRSPGRCRRVCRSRCGRRRSGC